jgi:hypothetical protein
VSLALSADPSAPSRESAGPDPVSQSCQGAGDIAPAEVSGRRNPLLLEPFEALANDHDFWNHTHDGLAVLGGPGLFHVFRLQRPVAELAVVADSFHTKPLRRFLQSVDRYQVLGLSLRTIQLFEGNRDALDEIDLGPGSPADDHRGAGR